MKKILLLLILIASLLPKEESSLDKFEKSLSDTTKTESNNNNNNNSSSKSKSNKEKNRFLTDDIDCHEDGFFFMTCSARDFLGDALFYPLIVAAVVSSPLWIPAAMNEYKDKVIFYDKYPFYSSNGLLQDKDEGGKSNITYLEISSYNFNNSIYGNKYNWTTQFSKKIGIQSSSTTLIEGLNNNTINKHIKDIMITYIFSANNFSAGSIDCTAGLGRLNWKSNLFKDSGTKIYYRIRIFVKPVTLNFSIGLASLTNTNLSDLNATIAYHYNRYSFTFGYQEFRTSTSKIGGSLFSIGCWF